jgi:hypothetical protein
MSRHLDRVDSPGPVNRLHHLLCSVRMTFKTSSRDFRSCLEWLREETAVAHRSSGWRHPLPWRQGIRVALPEGRHGHAHDWHYHHQPHHAHGFESSLPSPQMTYLPALQLPNHGDATAPISPHAAPHLGRLGLISCDSFIYRPYDISSRSTSWRGEFRESRLAESNPSRGSGISAAGPKGVTMDRASTSASVVDRRADFGRPSQTVGYATQLEDESP